MADTNFTFKSTVITADWLNQINRQVYALFSAAGIRSLDSTVYTRVRTLGYYGLGDGGNAEYWADFTDLTSPDNGGSVFVAADGTRWKIATAACYSVLQFGAKGDWNGTTGTDDAPAIASAIATLPSTGGRLYFPGAAHGRRYLLNSGITIPFPGHYTLYGDGGCEAPNNIGPTEIIIGAAVATAGIYVSGPFSVIRDLTIRNHGGSGNLIQLAANGAAVENCGVFSAGQDGIRIGADVGVNVNANNWLVRGCHIVGSGRYNLYVNDPTATGGPNVNGGTAADNLYQSAVNDGIRMDNAVVNFVSGGVTENNGGCGVRFNNKAKYNCVVGLDFDSGNGAGKLRCEIGSVGNRVDATVLFDTEIVDAGTDNSFTLPSSTPGRGYTSIGYGRITMATTGGACDIIAGSTSSEYLRVLTGAVAGDDSHASILVKSTGLYLGAATSGKVGFFGTTPVVQSTGWGAPTGAVKLTNFPGATATLAQTSAQVAAILNYLLLRGDIGA